MFNIKKIAALVCSIALVSATFVMPTINASAAAGENLSFGIKSGVTAPGTSGIGANKKYNTTVVVTLDGLFESEEDYVVSNAGLFEFYVTKDVFSQTVNTISLKENGMIGAVLGGDCTFMASVTPIEGNDDYDLLALTYYGADGFTTMTGDVVELRLTYNATSDFPEVEFIPKEDTTYISLCSNDSNLTVGERITTFVDTDYKYTLGAGTGTTASNIITKTDLEEEPPTPEVEWTTATQFGSDYHSDIDNSDAVAYTAELRGDGTEYDTVTWKVTPADGSAAKGCYADVKIGGTGTYTIGLVIGDVTSEQITSVEAALGAQGNAQ